MLIRKMGAVQAPGYEFLTTGIPGVNAGLSGCEELRLVIGDSLIFRSTMGILKFMPSSILTFM